MGTQFIACHASGSLECRDKTQGSSSDWRLLTAILLVLLVHIVHVQFFQMPWQGIKRVDSKFHDTVDDQITVNHLEFSLICYLNKNEIENTFKVYPSFL